MLRINESKLTPFDTQVLSLIRLAPDKWVPGTAPHLVVHHNDFGWFYSGRFRFGAQPKSLDSTNRARRLSWRGQILLRREVKQIRQSAIDFGVELGRPENFSITPPSGLWGGTMQTHQSLLSKMHAQAAALSGLTKAQVGAGQQKQTTAAAAAAAALGASQNQKARLHSLGNMYSALGPPPHPGVFGGKTREELRALGAEPSLLAAAFQGDAVAQDLLIDWMVIHVQ